MLKKFFAVAILGVALIFAGAQNKVESKDIFIGTSPATGWYCSL